jgi:hypothetical protein
MNFKTNFEERSDDQRIYGVGASLEIIIRIIIKIMGKERILQ